MERTHTVIGDSREKRVEAFWRKYLETLPSDSSVREESYEVEMFGDTIRLADEIGALISSGTKTATCSALWEYEAEGEPLPKVGEKHIVLDGRGAPLCVIETTEVEVRPYDEVDADFAFLEGEGDRSLEHWREAHGSSSLALSRASGRLRRWTCRSFVRGSGWFICNAESGRRIRSVAGS